MNSIKLALEMQKKFKQLMKLNEEIIAKIPNEHFEIKEQIQKDIAQITEATKNGDVSKLNELQKKYADNVN